jgi:hypothetical protein
MKIRLPYLVPFKMAQGVNSGIRIEPLTGYEKCIQLYSNDIKYDAPIYINTNGASPGIGIPIGGGISKEFKEIYSVLYGGQEKPTQTDWEFKLQGMDSNVSYINTNEDYINFLSDNSFINKHSFPVSLPLKVQTYKVDPASTLWKVHYGYIISNNRQTAVCDGAIHHTFRGWRKPVSIAIGCVWVISVAIYVMDWNIYNRSRQEHTKRFG